MAYNAQGAWEPEDDSVATGVARITSQNSPLMQQAKTAGAQQANRRGLLNSTMAVGASQAEVVKAALPIAAQDAQQTAQKNLAQQDFTQRGQLSAQEFGQNRQIQAADIASKEKVASMNVAAHDRQYAQAALAASDSAYAQQFNAIAQNHNIPADVRDQYLRGLAQMRDSSINMVQQMYGISLTWQSPTPASTK